MESFTLLTYKLNHPLLLIQFHEFDPNFNPFKLNKKSFIFIKYLNTNM